MNNENILFKSFIDIIDYLNKTKFSLDKKLIVKNTFKNEFIYDNFIFFNLGQLLSLFYLFNINTLNRKNITYVNRTFFIKDLFNKKDIINTIDSDCMFIAQNIIDKSVYNIEFLPSELKINNNYEYNYIKSGFIETYTALLNNKIYLTKLLQNYNNEELFTNTINNLRSLNYNDLNKQIKLLDIKLKNNYSNYNSKKEEFVCSKINSRDFIDLGCHIADDLIENSIIGIHNNDIEITWIGYIDENIQPLFYKNIYISLFLSYLYQNTDKKYYLQASIQSLNPALRYLNYNEKDENHLSILNSLYTLNSILDIPALNNFINLNSSLLKKYNINSSHKNNMNKYLLDISIKTINNIIK